MKEIQAMKDNGSYRKVFRAQRCLRTHTNATHVMDAKLVAWVIISIQTQRPA